MRLVCIFFVKRYFTLFKGLPRGGNYFLVTNSRINCVRDRQTVIPNRTKEMPRPHSQPKPPLRRQCKHLDIYSGERKRQKVSASASDNPQTAVCVSEKNYF